MFNMLLNIQGTSDDELICLVEPVVGAKVFVAFTPQGPVDAVFSSTGMPKPSFALELHNLYFDGKQSPVLESIHRALQEPGSEVHLIRAPDEILGVSFGNTRIINALSHAAHVAKATQFVFAEAITEVRNAFAKANAPSTLIA